MTEPAETETETVRELLAVPPDQLARRIAAALDIAHESQPGAAWLMTAALNGHQPAKKKSNRSIAAFSPPRLTQMIQRSGKEQAQVAAEAGLSRGAISMLKLGRRKPTMATLARLAEVLGCTVADFLDPQDLASVEPAHLVWLAAQTAPDLLLAAADQLRLDAGHPAELSGGTAGGCLVGPDPHHVRVP
jgi:transcriptional regulator with XRE-family HTH domain